MKGPSLEKMAEQLETSMEERHGDGAELFVAVTFALVNEDGAAQLHYGTSVPQARGMGEEFYRDAILGALKMLAETLADPKGEVRTFGR